MKSQLDRLFICFHPLKVLPLLLRQEEEIFRKQILGNDFHLLKCRILAARQQHVSLWAYCSRKTHTPLSLLQIEWCFWSEFLSYTRNNRLKQRLQQIVFMQSFDVLWRSRWDDLKVWRVSRGWSPSLSKWAGWVFFFFKSNTKLLHLIL